MYTVPYICYKITLMSIDWCYLWHNNFHGHVVVQFNWITSSTIRNKLSRLIYLMFIFSFLTTIPFSCRFRDNDKRCAFGSSYKTKIASEHSFGNAINTAPILYIVMQCTSRHENVCVKTQKHSVLNSDTNFNCTRNVINTK